MTQKTDREKRLAEALRQNLARRKAQQRARTAGRNAHAPAACPEEFPATPQGARNPNNEKPEN